jgi:serine/threonine protein kinase
MDETISISTTKDFEILKQIGKGSFGTVFWVKRKKDGIVYALKSMSISSIDKTSIENCLNEIRILCSIIHPNMVGYKEAFLDKKDTELNIVMEYVGGGRSFNKNQPMRKAKAAYKRGHDLKVFLSNSSWPQSIAQHENHSSRY